MTTIHQFVAGFTDGDAITNEARVIRGRLREWGFCSDIFSEPRCILPRLRGEAADVGDYAPVCRADDVVLLHLSVGSVVNDVFRSLPCRKGILYHNMTPSHYFDVVNKASAYALAKGREQLKLLKDVAGVNLAVSRYNAAELESLGYRDVKVLPLLLDLSALRGAADRKILRGFGDGKPTVLFVGRCAPNKKIEDLLRAFFFFQKTVEPDARFVHVGSFAGTERYHFTLLAYARELALADVHFVGSVSHAQLNAFYRCADLFLCMSEHEGFCIPIIESMHCGIPVLAYAAAAVPDTVDGAGVLFREKRFEPIAEMMGLLIRDTPLRSAVLAVQRERVDRYVERDLASELRAHLSPLLAP